MRLRGRSRVRCIAVKRSVYERGMSVEQRRMIVRDSEWREVVTV